MHAVNMNHPFKPSKSNHPGLVELMKIDFGIKGQLVEEDFDLFAG